MSAIEGIVLQNSKVAAVQIFGENLKRKEVDDSHSFSRAIEVAHEFDARRRGPSDHYTKNAPAALRIFDTCCKWLQTQSEGRADLAKRCQNSAIDWSIPAPTLWTFLNLPNCGSPFRQRGDLTIFPGHSCLEITSPSAPPPEDCRPNCVKIQSYLAPGPTLRGSGSSPAVRAPVYHWRAERGGGEFASLKGLQVLTIDLAREGFASRLALASGYS